MAVKTLEIKLSQLTPASGWSQDPVTGQWYYYDEEGNRYVSVAGYLYPMMIWESAPKLVNVQHGDTLRIFVSFKYSGPLKTNVKLFGAIGQNPWYDPVFDSFSPILTATSAAFNLDASSVPVMQNRVVDIPVTTAIETGKYYGIYAKLIDGVDFKERETGSVALKDAVFVVSFEPTFTEFQITDYKKV